MLRRRIYLDHASQTPLDPRVSREMARYAGPQYANPSSIYKEGVRAKQAISSARSRIAACLRAQLDEIVMTSGGTEANNLALEGTARAAIARAAQTATQTATSTTARTASPHLIISDIEHSSVMAVADALQQMGVAVTRIPVGPTGAVDPVAVRDAIRPETFMVSIMTVNNELGTIQPIREIAREIRRARSAISDRDRTRAPAVVADQSSGRYPLFHTDAAQAPLYIQCDVLSMGVDLMTLDGAKICGPRGTGALYVRRGTPLQPLMHGGGQERGMRSGTENVPSIMGLALAMELATDARSSELARVAGLRTAMLSGLQKLRPDITVQPAAVSAPTTISPHILNVSIPGIDNEFFVLQMDAQGIAASTRSSCLHDADQSYVIRAIGGDSRISVRFSFGRTTTRSDIRIALRRIAAILSR